jgi:uncharacterized membrane protein
MACCNVFVYMQGAWYFAYEWNDPIVVRATNIYYSLLLLPRIWQNTTPLACKRKHCNMPYWVTAFCIYGWCTTSVAISIHVTHYGPRSGIPYFSLKLWTLPQSRGLPCPPHGKDWVKDCTDVLNFSITSLLFSSAHKYSIGDKLDYKVANWERKNCFSWRINDKHRAASHYLCIDWKLVWLSLLKPPDLLSASPCGGHGSPLDWGRVQSFRLKYGMPDRGP